MEPTCSFLAWACDTSYAVQICMDAKPVFYPLIVHADLFHLSAVRSGLTGFLCLCIH